MTETESEKKTVSIGRNEACPCGSGKKYKRCCGIGAAPKLTPPKSMPQEAGFNPSEALGNMDPQMMSQFAQAFQRLPKGQLQRFQAIMQKAMSGKDVTEEARDFEKSLPLDFQNLLQSMALPAMAAAQSGIAPQISEPAQNSTLNPAMPGMTEEEARALVTKAAVEGKISQEQAASLLAGDTSEKNQDAETEGPKKSGFWRNLTRKNPK